MFVIVGLGNPGVQYEQTRHNVGFMLLDEIASECGVSLQNTNFSALSAKGTWHQHSVLLLKPQTFMNLSGRSVAAALSFYKVPVQNLICVFDDLDQAFAAVRARTGGGHGGHNGVRDILDKLSSDQFHRVKVGIGKSPFKDNAVNWVLGRFNPSEMTQLYEESFPLAKQRILDIMRQQSKISSKE